MRLFLNVLLVVASLLPAFAHAQRQELYSSDETIQLKITAPLSGEELNADTQTMNIFDEWKFPKVEAQLETQTPDGRKISLPIKIRLRGKDRLSNCAFPPYKISFKETDQTLKNQTVFRGLTELKLVTHCNRLPGDLDSDHASEGSDITVGPQAVRQEFLNYKILQNLTPVSFGVRYAEIVYVDSLGYMKTFKREAVLLEGESDIAARLGMRQLKDETPVKPEPLALARVELFQTLIGNYDYTTWNVPLTNMIALLREGDSGFTVVPYDLDRAVSLITSRFSPNMKFGTKSHICDDFALSSLSRLTPDQQTRLISEFQRLAAHAQALVRDDKILRASQKRPMTGYYAGFAAYLTALPRRLINLKCE